MRNGTSIAATCLTFHLPVRLAESRCGATIAYSGGWPWVGLNRPAVRQRSVGSAQAVQGTLAHWEQALVDVGFLDPDAPNDAPPEPAVQPGTTDRRRHPILRGVAKAMLQTAARQPGVQQDPAGAA